MTETTNQIDDLEETYLVLSTDYLTDQTYKWLRGIAIDAHIHPAISIIGVNNSSVTLWIGEQEEDYEDCVHSVPNDLMRMLTLAQSKKYTKVVFDVNGLIYTEFLWVGDVA